MLDSLRTQFAAIELIDWLAMFAGAIGVYLSIKERLSAWPLFIFCYSAYIYISLRSGYYALAIMNAIFVVIAIYGWCKWSGVVANSGKARHERLQISRTPRKYLPMVFTLVALCTIVIGALLSQMDTARLPFVDAFAMSTALAAQWMLSRKHIENWIFWIVSDIVYVSLFLNDRLWPSVFLFSAFILLAFKGLRDWQRSIANNIPASNS